MNELSASRVRDAIAVRAAELPHAFAWHFGAQARLNRERIMQYHNVHRGKRCFILANGPSLRETNLEPLSNEITFGLNRIYLLFDKTTFRPTYFVTMNELILEQFAGEIDALPMPKFLNWNRRLCYKAEDPRTIFLKSKMVIADSFQPDVTRPLVTGGTVTFVALQLAYYMGFRQVILIGLDHRYADKGTPSGTEVRTATVDQSHFHPQYFPKGIKWQLPDLVRSEIDFELARQQFEADGRDILDATIGGQCPVFKKAAYSSLFQ